MNDIGTIEENNAFVLGFASKGVLVIEKTATEEKQPIIKMVYEITEDMNQESEQFGKGYLLLWDNPNNYGIYCESINIDWGDKKSTQLSNVNIGNNPNLYTTRIYHTYSKPGKYTITINGIKNITRFVIQNSNNLKEFFADFPQTKENYLLNTQNFYLSNNKYLEKVNVIYSLINGLTPPVGFCYSCGNETENGINFSFDAPNITSTYSPLITSCNNIDSIYINAPNVSTLYGFISSVTDKKSYDAKIIIGEGVYGLSNVIDISASAYWDLNILNQVNSIRNSSTLNFLGLKMNIPNLQNLSNFASSITFNKNINYIRFHKTRKLKNISHMFSSSKNIPYVFIEDTSNITDCSWSFAYTDIKSLPFTDFSSAEELSYAFYECKTLEIPTGQMIDFPKLKNAWSTFSYCEKMSGDYMFRIGSQGITSTLKYFMNETPFNSLYLYLPGTVNIEQLSACFISNIESVSLILDFEKTGNLSRNIDQINLGHKIQNIKFLNIDSFQGIFDLTSTYIALNTKKIEITGFKNSRITKFIMDNIHSYSTEYVFEEFSFDGLPNTCEDISSCFYNKGGLKKIICNGFENQIDLCNVKKMSGTFSLCSDLQSLSFENGYKVEDMHGTFQNCSSLKSIQNLNIDSVKDIDSAFYYCVSLSNITFSGNSTSTVLSIELKHCALSHEAIISMFISLPKSYIDSSGNGGNILLIPYDYDTRENKNEVDLLTSLEISIATRKGWNIDADGICLPSSPGLYDANWELISSWDELIENGDIYEHSRFDDIYDIISKMEEEFNGNLIISNNVDSISRNGFSSKKLSCVVLPNNISLIEENAFYNCKKLESLILPDSITSIGEGILESCTSLKYVILSNNLTHIPRRTFCDCSALKSINLPNNIFSIGAQAFYKCTSLSSINMSENITEIGVCAFEKCKALKSISIKNIKTIPGSLFRDCAGLRNIDIPTDIDVIGGNAFESCLNLNNIPIFINISEINEEAFKGCFSLTDITILGGKTTIGNSAFYNCTALKNIVLSDETLSIGKQAFYNCSSLVNISIPLDVNDIKDETFRNCKSLTEVHINGDVLSIGYGAFRDCSVLSKINVPNTLIEIGDYAFYQCKKLKSLSFYTTRLETIGNYSFYYCDSLTSISLPPTVTSIGNYAFYYCPSLKSIMNIKATSITSIGNYAFYGCDLETISLPSTVTSIGDSAYQGCSYTYSVNIPNNVKTIGAKAFYNCRNAGTIKIPDSVTSIGTDAFYKVKRIIYNGTATGAPWGALSMN